MKKFALRLGIVVAIGAAVFFIFGKFVFRSISVAVNKMYGEKVRTFWKEEVASTGSAAAYAKLKKMVALSPQPVRHGVAHVFGEVLFQADGIDGLKVCDADFTFGCYHGFIDTAVNYKGIEIITQIDKECSALYGHEDTRCRHGIGHGLMDYFGAASLPKALAKCGDIGDTTLTGCVDGVVMEYLITVDGTRSLDSKKPYEPCAGLSGEYRATCYFELVKWWDDAFDHDYKKIGGLCGALWEKKEKDACMFGAGKSYGELHGFNAGKTIVNCAKFSERGDQVICQAGAYGVFTALGENTGSLCRTPSFSREENETCIQDSKALSVAPK